MNLLLEQIQRLRFSWEAVVAWGKGSVAYLFISGLGLYLGTESPWGQALLLTHIVSGALVGWCALAYLAHHARELWRKDAGASWWVAFGAMVATVVAILSGYALAQGYWLNRFALESALAWHKVGAVAAMLLTAAHLSAVLNGKRKHRTSQPVRHMLGPVGIAMVTGSLALLLGGAWPERAVHDDYPRSPDGTLFGPSNMATAHGGFFEADALKGSTQCAECHSQIAKEWSVTAHRFAGMENELVSAATKLAEEKRGVLGARFCGSCHEPVAMLAGEVEESVFDIQSTDTGVSCLACHGVADVPGFDGNGRMNFRLPETFLFHTSQNFIGRGLNRLLVRSNMDVHRREMNPPTMQTSHQCSSCHTVNATEEFNGLGFIRLHQQNDDWMATHFATGVGPDEEVVTCQGCHMPLVENSTDPAARRRGGQHRSHRFLAANTFVAKYHGDDEQLRLTEEYLRGNIRPKEIDHLLPQGKYATLRIQAEQPTNGVLPLGVVIANNWVGHGFPQGPIEVHETWLEVIVIDAEGRQIFASGLIDDEGRRDPDAFALNAIPVDREGNEIVATAGLAAGFRYRKNILTGRSERAQFEVALPETLQGPLEITARLLYRKADFEYQLFALGEVRHDMPITEIASDEATLTLE